MTLKTPKNSAKFRDEVAADWVARLDAGDLTPAQERELQQWLASDTRCLGAFARAQAIFASPHVALPTEVRTPVARRSFLVAAAAGLAGTAFILGHRAAAEKRIYVSELGEIRQIPLEDGSRITLNTNSAVQVEYLEDSRVVALQRGEAYFEVAKDSKRPFIVVGSSAQARAVGTAYSVRLGDEAGQMQIRVATGRVAVEAPLPPPAAPLAAIRNLFVSQPTNGAYLNANQEATVRIGKGGLDDGKIQVSIRDLQPGMFERSLMWRQGLLSFEGVTLAEAIAEFSRYSRQRILIRGALAHERISGLFAAADPLAFAHAVALSLRARVGSEQDTLILYRP
jgi:transmembrane sensor